MAIYQQTKIIHDDIKMIVTHACNYEDMEIIKIINPEGKDIAEDYEGEKLYEIIDAVYEQQQEYIYYAKMGV